MTPGIEMPRTKTTRNPLGSVTERRVTVQGKLRTVWDVRKRYALIRADGSPVLDARGRTVYRDKTKRCYSRTEANAVLASMPAEVERELREFREADEKERTRAYTFRDLVTRYLESEVKPAVFVDGRKMSGYKQDLSNLRLAAALALEFFGDRLLAEITFDDLRGFRDFLLDRGTRRGGPPSVSTLNNRLSIVRRMFNLAVQMYWLDVSPFKRGRHLIDRAGENVRNRMLTFEEEEKLLQACSGVRKVSYRRRNRKNSFWGEGSRETTAILPVRREHLRPLIVFALDTAMRAGEIFGLEWGNVDLENRVIVVTGAGTKTGRAGLLPISDRVLAILRERYNGQGPQEKVFPRFDYKRSFKAACADAGILDLQFRDLRSTAATRMVLAGSPESQVMKITRHTRLKTFLRHYSNVDAANARAIGDRLSRFVEEETRKRKAK